MAEHSSMTAFSSGKLLCSGAALEVALAVKAADPDAAVLIFEDSTGRQIDLDLRGSEADIAARFAEDEPAPDEVRPRGRPRLGVVAREITLLPRHWDWLAEQPGGASVTLRKLIDAARSSGDARAGVRRAQQAADRVMMALLGNRPGYEEAARALYSGDAIRFRALSEAWPGDARDYVRRLAAPAFPAAEAE